MENRIVNVPLGLAQIGMLRDLLARDIRTSERMLGNTLEREGRLIVGLQDTIKAKQLVIDTLNQAMVITSPE